MAFTRSPVFTPKTSLREFGVFTKPEFKKPRLVGKIPAPSESADETEAIGLCTHLRVAHEMQAGDELESLAGGWNQEVVVSHIRQLPAEILIEIFRFAEGDTYYNVFNASPRHGPIRFALVCAMWRAVSLDCTVLWARLSVKISCTSKLSEQSLAHLERVLAFSRNRLIDIKFDMEIIFDLGLRDLAASHLWALTSHCGRWQKVHLTMPTFLLKNISQHILDNVSALADITLVNVHDNSRPLNAEDPPRICFLENAPLLRRVSVCGFSHSRLLPIFDTHVVAFPFHESNVKLQTFEVHGGSAWHAVDCLKSQPLLRHLSVLNTDSSMDGLSLPSVPISKHSSLSSISTTSPVILDAIELPGLRSASLVPPARTAPNPDRVFDALAELLKRSDAQLERLTVRDLPLSQHIGFIPMLTGLSSLITISLTFTGPKRQRDSELQYLIKRLLSMDFLPRLASVQIDFSYVFYPKAVHALNSEEFLRMLHLRCSEGALRHLKLASSGEPLMSAEQEESVKKLVECGLTADLRLRGNMPPRS